MEHGEPSPAESAPGIQHTSMSHRGPGILLEKRSVGHWKRERALKQLAKSSERIPLSPSYVKAVGGVTVIERASGWNGTDEGTHLERRADTLQRRCG